MNDYSVAIRKIKSAILRSRCRAAFANKEISIRQLPTAEFAGKSNFYLSALDEYVKFPTKYQDILQDAKTLEGIFLDKEQDKADETLTEER